MNRVRLAFFSLGGRPPDGDHRAYVEWHQLDHMPEQYQLPGMILGSRWFATPVCVAARAAVSEDLEPVRHAVAYLMGSPVESTLDEFAALGRRLALLGRMPPPLSSHLLGGFQQLDAWAAPRALVSAEVVPWRPHRGIYLLVEETGPNPPLASLDDFDVPGVAGAWVFGASPIYERPHWTHRSHRVTVCWLDDDPVAAAAELLPVLDRRWAGGRVRPVLAMPFEALVSWEWGRVPTPAGAP